MSLASYRPIILYALLSAALILVIRFAETYFLIGTIPLKTYVAIIGVVFLAIGIWVGVVFRKKQDASQPHPDIHINPNEILSGRENDVLAQLVAGYSTREIADRLFVSENTVKTHLNNIYSKLGVNRRSQAIAKARTLKLVE
ncbi:MAG: LuxR C-terminal-related transcriptional regulator [Bacteroidota bacterium]